MIFLNMEKMLKSVSIPCRLEDADENFETRKGKTEIDSRVKLLIIL